MVYWTVCYRYRKAGKESNNKSPKYYTGSEAYTKE
jgi:hypothetical protein